MAFGIFGKGKSKEPQPKREPFSINGVRAFEEGRAAGEYAATITNVWNFPPQWEEPPVDPEKLIWFLEMNDTESDFSGTYLVDEQTGAVGTVEYTVEEDDDFDVEEIDWVAFSTIPKAQTCPGCGAPVKPGDKFCESCGRKLS